MTPRDKIEDYFNFMHPHRWAPPGAFVHRLGKFQARGRGKRGRGHKPRPSLGILHVPHADIVTRTGVDVTAERMAAYLANPSDRRNASIHAFSDRDSYIICQPFDSEAWGAANSWANAAAIQFEIGGRLFAGDDYWNSSDAARKLEQTAKAIVRGSWLAFGLDWEWCIPRLEVASLNENGSVKHNGEGWTQHREVPFYDRRRGVYNQPDENNQVKGQNPDVTRNFPWNTFFEILADEMRRFRLSGNF